MKRETGYYWVKYEGEWVIAYSYEWMENDKTNYYWTLTAFIDDSWWFDDNDFDEIDEHKLTRK